MVRDNQVNVYDHNDFWYCMDTHKEVEEMNEHWEKDPFWKIWN